jgi:hypothetical protein
MRVAIDSRKGRRPSIRSKEKERRGRSYLFFFIEAKNLICDIKLNNMKINETNKALYEIAFIENGEFGYHGSTWKPDIDEREISEMSETQDGNWIPATPLGYRDYLESRKQGLKNIFDQYPAVNLTDDKLHQIRRDSEIIRKYDKIKTDQGDFIVTGDDEDKYYVVNPDNKLFCVEYL